MSRYLEWTAKQLAHLTRRQFLDSIRASEGRVVGTYVCPKSINYVEKVSNIELMASFGADFITLEGFDPKNLQMPGLTSRDVASDLIYRDALQADMGFGWTLQEMKELVGRPIGLILTVPRSENDDFGLLYNKSRYSTDMIEFALKEGYDFVVIGGLSSDSVMMKILLDAINDTRKIVGEQLTIVTGIPHGSGTSTAPYDLQEIVTPDMVRSIAQAGADIIGLPAVGIIPGFTQEYTSSLVRAAHDERVLAGCTIAHSIEGADSFTVKKIVLDNKPCGFDLFDVSAGGVYESVPLPEIVMDICIAAKGRRHTYRRMCQSPLHE